MSRPAKRVRLSPVEDEDSFNGLYGTDEDPPPSENMYLEYTQSEDEDDGSEDADQDDDDDAPQDGEDDVENDSEDDNEDDNNEGSDSHSSDDDDDDSPYTAPPRDPVRDELRQISFGALLDAQYSLPPATVPRIRRHGAPTSDPAAKVNVLRERLAELKALKEKKNSGDASAPAASSKHASKPDTRSHKHAPMEQSSKYQVTRKRAALLTSSNPYHARDPRFSAATSGRSADAASIRRNYAFLANYSASELAELKGALKTTRDAADKERLKREITVRESRARAEADKERARKVVREHRGAQKEAVAQGKRPFFLKQGEIRKRVLVDKFESMKGKEREHAMTRRRKKESQRERRNMPDDRRGV